MSGILTHGLRAIIESKEIEIAELREELHNARRIMQADRDDWDNKYSKIDPFTRVRGYLIGVAHAESTKQ